MGIAIGNQLGSHQITGLLGKGGMGEVWLAHDRKLGRDVALKSLPPEFASSPDRLARFEREARLLAALNHANVAGIYGLEEHAGTRLRSFLDGADGVVVQLQLNPFDLEPPPRLQR